MLKLDIFFEELNFEVISEEPSYEVSRVELYNILFKPITRKHMEDGIIL